MTCEAKATAGSDVAAGLIVAIPLPPPAVRASVARLIVEILARRALADVARALTRSDAGQVVDP